jgi:hypothetical protein
MHAVLLHAIIPDRSQPQRDWANFAREAEQIRLPQGAEKLADNVWLLPPRNQNPTLTTLLSIAKKHATACRSLAVDATAAWQSHP